MALLVWIALAFFGVALVVSLAVAVIRGLRAWRTFRALSTASTEALEKLTAGTQHIERHVAELEGNLARLTDAQGRLEESLAELAVIREAGGEAAALVALLRGAVPKK